MGRPRRPRRARRVVASTLGLVVALQASAVVGAQVANASTCSFAGGILTVTLTGGEDPTFGLAADGDTITLDVCPPDGATVSSTIAITVDGDGGDNVVTIDMANGVFTGIVWSLSGGGGDDSLVVDGSDRNDHVVVGASGVDLDGDGAIDILSLASIPSGAGSLTINGAGGDDVLTAYGSRATGDPYAEPVTIDGGTGDDDIGGGSAADALDGGDGSDAVDYARFRASVTVDLTTPAVSGGGGDDTIAGFENIVGSRRDDVLTGDASDNRIVGGPGDDTIDCVVGSAGDFVDLSDSKNAVVVSVRAGTATGDGTDRFTNCPSVDGSDKGDTITGSSGFNDLEGGAGNDVLSGLGGNDRIAGLAGRDWVDYGWARHPVTLSLSCNGNAGRGTIAVGPHATQDAIDGIENAILTSGDDTFFGNEVANTVRPNGGRDTLDGDGDATVCGAAPAASPGDTVDYSVGYGTGVRVDLAGGGAARDSIVGFENVIGTAFGDRITGDDGPNTIKARKGNDDVDAANGDDIVRLGSGDDTGAGGGGNDELFGAKGNDTLLGGGGVDRGEGGPGKDACRAVEISRSCGTVKHPR